MQRRQFLSLATTFTSALLGAALSVPFLGQLLSPLRRRDADGGTYVAVGGLTDFPIGEPRRVAFPVSVEDGWVRKTTRQAAWVVRTDEGAVKVFSSTCPHLGCSVNWRQRRDEFVCPCHDSGFARDGARKHGPARRGLDELPVRVIGGDVEVRWVEYEPGTADRVPVGGTRA